MSLRVRDLATIADATLDLQAGLNVLTGETGAGKSMLIDALALLLGDRADRAVIRPGADRAAIEGSFGQLPNPVRVRLDELGIDQEDELIVRREVNREGRSRGWLNGSITTMGVLSELGEMLVDLHGQHQTVQLLTASTQRRLLDAFAAAEGSVETVALGHAALADARRRHDELSSRRAATMARAESLHHTVAEISAAKLVSGEEEALAQELRRLSQTDALAASAAALHATIEGEPSGLRSGLRRAERSLAALGRNDPETASWQELLDTTYAALDELARRVALYQNDITADPTRLAALEGRRERLADLRRKYGPTLADVIAVGRSAAAELTLLDTAELDLRALAAEVSAAEQALAARSVEVTALRSAAKQALAERVTPILRRLGLVGAEFHVVLTPLPHVEPHGAESVSFVVRLNRGLEPQPLARTASGGELSRVMLALKVALAAQDDVPTLVFDEIDQGVGGDTAGFIGEALGQVAARHQVLAITHLPQIAAYADRHLRVVKTTGLGVAMSDVMLLDGADRVVELARMLGDPDGKAARRMATDMLRGRAR